MSKIKFNFNKKKLLAAFLRYRYLFILIFFSMLLAFVFNIMYRYSYADISFIEYEEQSEGRVSSNIKKGNRVLREVLKRIEEREERFKAEEDIKYNNPFESKSMDIPKDDKSKDHKEDDDPLLYLPEDDLIPAEPIEPAEPVDPIEPIDQLLRSQQFYLKATNKRLAEFVALLRKGKANLL